MPTVVPAHQPVAARRASCPEPASCPLSASQLLNQLAMNHGEKQPITTRSGRFLENLSLASESEAIAPGVSFNRLPKLSHRPPSILYRRSEGFDISASFEALTSSTAE